MRYLVRFEVECIIEVDDDERTNDFDIIAQAVRNYLIERLTDDVKIRPCHVEAIEED